MFERNRINVINLVGQLCLWLLNRFALDLSFDQNLTVEYSYNEDSMFRGSTPPPHPSIFFIYFIRIQHNYYGNKIFLRKFTMTTPSISHPKYIFIPNLTALQKTDIDSRIYGTRVGFAQFFVCRRHNNCNVNYYYYCMWYMSTSTFSLYTTKLINRYTFTVQNRTVLLCFDGINCFREFQFVYRNEVT